MKKSVLSLIAVAVLSSSAFADVGSDPILASFERDMAREPSAPAVQLARAEADPLAAIFSAAFAGQCGARQPRALVAVQPAAGRVGG